MRLCKKRFGRVVMILLCIVMATLMVVYETTAGNNEWGIYFNVPGEKPVIDISEDVLKANEAYYMGDGQKKHIYLTFDAGYENGLTPRILDILKKTDVPAAFFLVGAYIQRNPEIVKRMVEEGHIVANHTMTHPERYVLDDREELRKELTLTEKEFLNVTGLNMSKYFRPPCGKFNKNSLKAANELGYKTIFWSLAYDDFDEYNQPSEWTAMKRLISYVHPGAVVLLHNMCRTNANILEELISQYRLKGYTFMRLDDLVRQ